jgi:hypothetical protein
MPPFVHHQTTVLERVEEAEHLRRARMIDLTGFASRN